MAEDVVLRSLAPADVAELYRLTDASRGRLRRWLAWVDATVGPDDTHAFVCRAQAQAAAGTGVHFAIRAGESLAGTIGYERLQPPTGVDVGYWLGDGFEGRGLATAACRALVTHAFATAGVHRVQIRAAVGNARSRAVPERLGFRLEGVLRESEHLPGGWVDHCVYGMLAADWTRLRGLRPGTPSPRPSGAPGGLAEHRLAEGRPASAHEDEAAVDAEMAAYYEARAPEYDDWYERRGRYADPGGDASWFRELASLHAVVGGFATSLPAGAAVLDVGCGTGRWTAALAQQPSLTVVGLDRSPAMVAEAHGRLQRVGLRALLVRGDALELPFPAAAFDAAFSGFVFDHLSLAQRPPFFAELRRVVRPAGRILMVDSRLEARHTADVEIQNRPLRDGRRFRVRKTLFTAASLREALSPLGPARVGETPNFFVWGEIPI